MDANLGRTRCVLVVVAVLSVGVGAAVVAGPAAADVASADRTVASNSVAPGGTTTVTTTVEMDGSGGSLSLSEAFSPSVQSAGNLEVTVDGSTVSPAVGVIDQNGVVVTMVGVPGGATVEVTYEVTVSSAAGTTHTITGNATGDSTTLDVGSTAIAVTTQPASFEVSNLTAPSRVTAGDDAAVNATVTNTGGVQGTKTVELRFDGSTVDTRTVSLNAGENATVAFVLNTSGVAPGSYTYGVFTADDDETATLQIDPQCSNLSAIANQYDADDDCDVDIGELGTAAADYAQGQITIGELGQVAAAYAST